jgi:apolipoprotein N-acyltransferase
LILRSRYLLAIVAGLTLAASFPKIGFSGLAWIAPGLMLVSAIGKRGWEAFRIGYVAGLTYHLASLSWLLLIPYRWHGIPFGPAAGWLALSGYVALYPAFWVWLVSGFQGSTFRVQDSKFDAALAKSRSLGVQSSVSRLLPETWLNRTLWALSAAALWVALEMVQARLFTGFPWNLLGASQYQLVPLIQIASFTGIYGVSFLIIWISLSLLCAALMLIQKPHVRSAYLAEIFLPIFVVAILFAFGLRQVRLPSTAARTLKVTLVQPSIPQEVIWDEDKSDARFAELIQLSKEALSNRTDLLIWPEAAVPKLLRYYEEVFQPITELARSNHVWMIVGADDMEHPAGTTRREDRQYFNSSFLIGPEGKLIEDYRKRALVIFGEYVPLAHWLPFMKWFTPIEGQFTPGERAVPFELENPHAKTSVLICFEDIFPHLAREYADDDTDFLVNITNNGWFGEGAAQWQHGASALFRAIENGLPLIRCSNNGLTCWVDERGRIQRYFRDRNGTIYGPGFMTVEIPLLADGAKRPRTFYNQHGDLFGWVCVVIGLAMVVGKIIQVRGAKTQFKKQNHGETES